MTKQYNSFKICCSLFNMTQATKIENSTYNKLSLAVEHFQINFKQYGLVISDLRMPVMNGYEFIKKSKEIKPEVIVFIMTAFEIDYIEFRSVLPYIKIDEFIDKPISGNNLTATVKKHIENETKNELDKDIIDKLDIPAGLKGLLLVIVLL